MNIRFTRVRNLGDATSVYDLSFDKGLTVKEFVNWVFRERQREWGTISVNGRDIYSYGSHGTGGNLHLELSNLGDMEIDHIYANGGWGLMDYSILTKVAIPKGGAVSMEILKPGSDDKIREYDEKQKQARMVTLTCERCGCEFRVDPQTDEDVIAIVYGVSANCPYCDHICGKLEE